MKVKTKLFLQQFYLKLDLKYSLNDTQNYFVTFPMYE